MKRVFIVFVLSFISYCSLNAQELVVSKFDADPADLSAVVHQVADLNGDPCALIKVGLTEAGAIFEGDIIKAEQKDGEYWVYMIGGSNWITIKTANYTPLRYEFAAAKGNTTYIMLVNTPTGRPAILPVKLTPAATIGGKTGSPVEFNLLLVKGGMFEMGATSEQEGADADEKPVHWVRLSKDFYMGETEVTQALWEFVMGSNNPSTFKDPNHPVEMINWNECQEFIRKLNDLTKAKFRLPTEAEWEYVARGGNKTLRTQYSGSANLDEVAWYYGNSQNSTHPVKTKKPNELGFYDMSGNVWEFCADYKNDYPEGEVTDPVGSKQDKNRVRRGGAWDNKNPGELRVAFRRRVETQTREKGLGLRLVMEVN